MPQPTPHPPPARLRPGERGQATVELVVVLPALVLVLAVAWQAVLAAEARWAAGVAARASARAAAVGASPEAAARAHLPERLERGLAVRPGPRTGLVRVSVVVPGVVRGLEVGAVSATGAFEAQR